MRLPVPRLLLFACALYTLVALLPASASAATKKKAGAYPVVSKVSPLKLGVGDVMTITGKTDGPDARVASLAGGGTPRPFESHRAGRPVALGMSGGET